nr:hypothetical protein [Tanacetum cinerariifolium]
MLEKGGYDTWQSRILLYIKGKEHEEMLLDSIFSWPFKFKEITIPTNEATRRRAETCMQTLKDLTREEKIRKECDIRAANIILHGLPNDIYILLNYKTKACDIWKRVKDSMWFKEKMLLKQQQEAWIDIGAEKQDFLADGLEGFDSDYLHKEVFEMKQIFEGMETDVNACSVEKKDFEIEKQQLLIKNDRLLEERMSCDIMCTILHSVKEFDASFDLSCIFIDNCANCESIKTKLFNQRENVDNKSFNELSKRFEKLKEYSISLEHCLQHYKEKIICNESWKKHDASLIIEFNNKS